MCGRWGGTVHISFWKRAQCPAVRGVTANLCLWDIFRYISCFEKPSANEQGGGSWSHTVYRVVSSVTQQDDVTRAVTFPLAQHYSAPKLFALRVPLWSLSGCITIWWISSSSSCPFPSKKIYCVPVSGNVARQPNPMICNIFFCIHLWVGKWAASNYF